jgi:hypothetical protein
MARRQPSADPQPSGAARKAHNRRWRYEAMRALLLLASFWVLPLGAEAQTCRSFRTCEEAMRSFLNDGNTRLDGNGNGVPCENLVVVVVNSAARTAWALVVVRRVAQFLAQPDRTHHLQLRKGVASCPVTTPEEWPKASG